MKHESFPKPSFGKPTCLSFISWINRMKKILRKIVFTCAVLVMGSAISIFATTIFAMKICYSNDYLLDIVGVTPKATNQTSVIQQ